MEEIWKDIKGYEGLYQVSNLGRVRSLKYGKERVLKTQLDKDGYECLMLYKNGKHKTCRIHRLVAEAFIPNPDGLPCINHINECKQSNVVTNLEWCSVAYNNSYGTRNERISKRVYQYTLDGSYVRSYYSTREAERQTGIWQQSICGVVLGKRNSAGNYIWSYDPPTPSTNRVLW